MRTLVEREALIARVRGVCERAREGEGGVAVLEGDAGVGKTSPLDAVAGAATGFRSVRAAPVELERSFGLGVVRRLFGSLLGAGERDGLFVGPGAGARRVLEDVAAPSPVQVEHAVFYGLYWILARELGVRGITVNAVSPGATETETYRTGRDPEFVAGLERMSVFNRLGEVEEIADVVAFVAGDQARWITGQNIRVNGGTV